MLSVIVSIVVVNNGGDITKPRARWMLCCSKGEGNNTKPCDACVTTIQAFINDYSQFKLFRSIKRSRQYF